MNDPLEENTKDCFLCDWLTLFGSTLKDSFVLNIEEYYWILYGLSEPLPSIGGYKNQTRQSRRLCEDQKEHRTLKNNTVRSLTSKDHEYDAENIIAVIERSTH